MGAGGSKERISKADMEFLLLHTHYDEKTIQGNWLKHLRKQQHFIELTAKKSIYHAQLKTFFVNVSVIWTQNGTEASCRTVLMVNSTPKASWRSTQNVFLKETLLNSVIMFSGGKVFATIHQSVFSTSFSRTFDTDKNGSIDFKEFLLAIDVTSNGCPEEKLNWAFRWVNRVIPGSTDFSWVVAGTHFSSLCQQY